MNTSSLFIYFENGNSYDIHLPDPSYQDGYVVVREYIDISNPDTGIWLEREYMSLAPEDSNRQFAPMLDRSLLCSPEELSQALLVTLRGLEALRRMPDAHFRCGLEPVLPESLGFTEIDLEISEDWIVEGLLNVASRCEAAGLSPVEVFSAALKRYENSSQVSEDE